MATEKNWKQLLADVLRVHKDIGGKFTGKIEINLNDGGVSKVYITNKEIK
jgi:hypothetical protein